MIFHSCWKRKTRKIINNQIKQVKQQWKFKSGTFLKLFSIYTSIYQEN